MRLRLRVPASEKPHAYALAELKKAAARGLDNIDAVVIIDDDGAEYVYEGAALERLKEAARLLREIELYALEGKVAPEDLSVLCKVLRLHPELGLAYKDLNAAAELLAKCRSKLLRKASKKLRAITIPPPTIVRRCDVHPRTNLSDDVRGRGEVLEEYEVGAYRVAIIHDDERLIYSYELDRRLAPYVTMVQGEFMKAARELAGKLVDRPLDELLEAMERRGVEILLRLLGSHSTARQLALHLAFEALGLGKIAPLLLDEDVEEFYLDRPGTAIYLDHAKWGRCDTRVVLDEQDVERIITHLRLESGKDITWKTPSLKVDLRTRLFHVRVSVDAPPLAHEGYALDFRKLRIRWMTLAELVARGTCDPEVAGYLMLAVRHRRNIVIVGEPGSGKTTLLNALDLCTPSWWRKIYIEDVVESLDQRPLGYHQLRLRVPTYEEGEDKSWSKSAEIIKLLHRTPDYVILGEIQTPDHSKALFQALASGMRVIATAHSEDVEGIILRWLHLHGIHPLDVKLIDLIVFMRRDRARGVRRIERVVEFRNKFDHEIDLHQDIVDIYVFDGTRWVEQTPLEERPLIGRILREEHIGLSQIKVELEIYRELIRRCSSSPRDVSKFITSVRQLDRSRGWKLEDRQDLLCREICV